MDGSGAPVQLTQLSRGSTYLWKINIIASHGNILSSFPSLSQSIPLSPLHQIKKSVSSTLIDDLAEIAKVKACKTGIFFPLGLCRLKNPVSFENVLY